MRRWWSRKGLLWLAFLIFCVVICIYNDQYIGYSRYSVNYYLQWLLVSYWFPAVAVLVCLIGASEATHYADGLLRNTTIPELRLPLKIRAIVCFSQCIRPMVLLTIAVGVMACLRSLPGAKEWLTSSGVPPYLAYYIDGLDLLEVALISLWCVGLLVVKPDKQWMSYALLACFFVYSANDIPYLGSMGRPPFAALYVTYSYFEALSYLAIVGCIVSYSRGWSNWGYRLFLLLVAGTILGLPDWMSAITQRGLYSYLLGGSSFLPCGLCMGQSGYLFAWEIDSLDVPLLATFVNLFWVGVQYLIFFNFVFEDNLISPTRKSRR